MLNKKESIQQTLEEGFLILRNVILCAAYSIFIPLQGTRYQLMSVLFKKEQSTLLMLIALIRL